MTAYQEFNEISAPASPSADAIRLYAKDDAGTTKLFSKNSAGTETELGGSGGSTLPIADTTAVVKGSADATKLVRIEADGLTTGTTRVITMPDANTTLPVASQVLTFSGPTAARTITFPDAAITVARTDAANTFTGTQVFSSNPTFSGLTAGSIPVATTAGAITQSNANLFWDVSNSRLGVGDNAPDRRFVVKGTSASNNVMAINNEGNSASLQFQVWSGTQVFHAPNFSAVRSRGTQASPAAVVSGDVLFNLDISGQETTTTQNTAARIIVEADGTPGTNDMPGRISFATTADGASSPSTRLTINSAGSIIVGNSSSALGTTATGGFLYVPSCAGLPTGVPTAITGVVPIVVDTTNSKLYFYSGGAWKASSTV
jgi:hypothetical protein